MLTTMLGNTIVMVARDIETARQPPASSDLVNASPLRTSV
jgi:hypothetical protein